jgi:hypothetical protein
MCDLLTTHYSEIYPFQGTDFQFDVTTWLHQAQSFWYVQPPVQLLEAFYNAHIKRL